jgi:hypothetical protein
VHPSGFIITSYNTWPSPGYNKPGQLPQVVSGSTVEECQILASKMPVLTQMQNLSALDRYLEGYIQHLLTSRERTQRLTGIKLAKVRGFTDYCTEIGGVVADREEDVYVRLEGASYLASTCGGSTSTLFMPFLNDADQQNRLEAVIALGETVTDESVEILGSILNERSQPEFLRSAAAWSLGMIGTESFESMSVLIIPYDSD